ncbi:transposase [Flammeovirga yaeyamensis]|uniref:Transposase n=1 Tax=Flammeovirga yaeyamensis TaxID=367791 RepID=A0AAX1NCK2_9BACT|nr:transposase [Flammeovirga yaeyamensis]MBB3696765.1 REP element-mobilizing transposase RayT [Flammeovirga yaeyamensis]NMF33432.1 transposase [Flammeovirga yaeyamensis]QWG05293.1 transposase [Flammeovirga yaeyamensis]
MSKKYKFLDQSQCYFVTLSVVKWIDIFTRKEYIDIVIDSLKFCQQNKGLVIHAYVIMTNHIHLVISSKEMEVELEYILRDIKKYTSANILKAIKDNPFESRKNWILWLFETEASHKKQKYQFWQHGNHPIELSNSSLLNQKIEYIHQNPVRNGIVNEPDEYLLSSARHYSGKKFKILDVELI